MKSNPKIELMLSHPVSLTRRMVLGAFFLVYPAVLAALFTYTIGHLPGLIWLWLMTAFILLLWVGLLPGFFLYIIAYSRPWWVYGLLFAPWLGLVYALPSHTVPIIVSMRFRSVVDLYVLIAIATTINGITAFFFYPALHTTVRKLFPEANSSSTGLPTPSDSTLSPD